MSLLTLSAQEKDQFKIVAVLRQLVEFTEGQATDLTTADANIATLTSSLSTAQANIATLTTLLAAVNYGSFSVNRNGSNQTVTAGIDTKIQFTTEALDTNSLFDNVTNFRYQPDKAGQYFVHLSLWATDAAGDANIAKIYKNGSAFKSGSGYAKGVTGAGIIPSSVSALVQLNGSTDYIEGWFYSAGVTLSGALTDTFMLGWRVL